MTRLLSAIRSAWAWLVALFRGGPAQLEQQAVELAKRMHAEYLAQLERDLQERRARERVEYAEALKRLQPEDHGPASRFAIVVGGMVNNVVHSAESQARIIAERAGGKAYELREHELCAIGEPWPDSIPTVPNQVVKL